MQRKEKNILKNDVFFSFSSIMDYQQDCIFDFLFKTTDAHMLRHHLYSIKLFILPLCNFASYIIQSTTRLFQ